MGLDLELLTKAAGPMRSMIRGLGVRIPSPKLAPAAEAGLGFGSRESKALTDAAAKAAPAAAAAAPAAEAAATSQPAVKSLMERLGLVLNKPVSGRTAAGAIGATAAGAGGLVANEAAGASQAKGDETSSMKRLLAMLGPAASARNESSAMRQAAQDAETAQRASTQLEQTNAMNKARFDAAQASSSAADKDRDIKALMATMGVGAAGAGAMAASGGKKKKDNDEGEGTMKTSETKQAEAAQKLEMALFHDVFVPVFKQACARKGITFANDVDLQAGLETAGIMKLAHLQLREQGIEPIQTPKTAVRDLLKKAMFEQEATAAPLTNVEAALGNLLAVQKQ